MKNKLLLLIALLTFGALAENVQNVTFQQRWPWNGKFDISYTLTKTTTKTSPVFAVKFYGKIGNGATFELTNIVDGDGYTGIVFGDGQKRVTWDASAQLGTRIVSDKLKIAVAAEDITEIATYLKLDLTTYKMTASTTGPSVAAGASSKYAELWLRRIENGTFVMGATRSEPWYYSDEKEHTVTLTKAYYIGVFELTQGQYNRINADGTSTAVVPQGNISYNTLRGTSYGATWPVKNDHRVDATSFFGKLRTKTGNGLIFDLPTEAQWEAAARWKGTTGNGTNDYYGTCYWNNGVPFTDTYPYGINDVAWYYGTAGGKTHEVGLKAPSTSGTYDMHGNVVEWCLDWYADDITSYVSDPDGPLFGSSRSDRGGCYPNPPKECRIALRYSTTPSIGGTAYGCRVALVFE